MKLKTITEVAESFGVSTRTIRYYEEIGLLAPDRSGGNQRLYSSAELAKLKLIFRGKRYGFSLDDIKEMVLLFDKDRSGRKQLEVTIEYGKRRIGEINRKIQELQEMKSEMNVLIEEFTEKLDMWKGECGNEQFTVAREKCEKISRNGSGRQHGEADDVQ